MGNQSQAVFPPQDNQDKDTNHHIKEQLEEQELEHSEVQVQAHQVEQATISKLKNIEK